mgnify:CR=1 FL=1
MKRLFIKLNNWITRLRRVKVPGRNILLIAPHCLQNGKCEADIKAGTENCLRCGKCCVAGLLDIGDRYGLICRVAGGGRQALECVKQPDVKAVVAVACEPELTAGILASFPRPVLAVNNLLPNGPCKHTEVNLEKVESAVRQLLAHEKPVNTLDEAL